MREIAQAGDQEERAEITLPAIIRIAAVVMLVPSDGKPDRVGGWGQQPSEGRLTCGTPVHGTVAAGALRRFGAPIDGMLGAEADGQAVPHIDRPDRHVILTISSSLKCWRSASKSASGARVCGEQRQRFRPAEHRPFLVREDGRFLPRAKSGASIARRTVAPRFLDVHVDAIGAAIDLRGAYLDEMDDAGRKPAFLHHIAIERGRRPDRPRATALTILRRGSIDPVPFVVE